jgi:hypothetical protein
MSGVAADGIGIRRALPYGHAAVGLDRLLGRPTASV